MANYICFTVHISILRARGIFYKFIIAFLVASCGFFPGNIRHCCVLRREIIKYIAEFF